MKQKEEKAALAQQESNLTLLLPTYNEEAAIGKVLDEVKTLPFPCRVLVGDNMSSDRTFDMVKSKGVTPIRVPSRGKGSVIRWLIGQIDTPYVIMVNADYTYPLKYAATIYKVLEKSEADVVVGYRAIKEKGSMSLLTSFGNWNLSVLASVLYGKRIYDLCSGMWGFRTDVLRGFYLTSRGFTLEADLFTNTMRGKHKFTQIPIAYRARLDSSNSKLKLWDGFKIAGFLLRRRFGKG